MRSSSKKVFELIYSLTPSERRFFQRFALRHGGDSPKYYLRLFDLAVETGRMKEEEWRAALGERGEDRYYPVLKHYLYERLLEALSEFHGATDPIEEIKQGLHQCRILMQKGMLEAAAGRWKKLRKKIDKAEAWEQLPEYLLVQRQLLDQQYYRDQDVGIEQIAENLKEAQEYLNSHYDYWGITASLALRHYMQAPDSQAAFASLTTELEKMDKPDSFRNRFLWHRAHAVEAFSTQKVEKAFEHNTAILQLLNENTHWKKRQASLYLSVLTNYLIDCFRLQKDQEIDAGIAEMRALNSQQAFRQLKNFESRVFRFTYMMQLNQSVRTGMVGDVDQLLNDLKAGLEQHRDKIAINHRLSLQYLMAYLLFSQDRYQDSLDWLEFFFLLNDKTQIQELQQASTILEIMNHIELDNQFLLEGLFRSVRKRFKISKKKKPSTFGLLNHLNKISNSYTAKDRLKRVGALSQFIENNSKDNELRTLNNYFNFLVWIKSKEKVCSFSEELSNQYDKK